MIQQLIHPLARLNCSLLLAIGAIVAGGSPALAQGLDLPFTVTKPAGNGPFPAVVLLHDCSGLGPGSSVAPWRWSSELSKLGSVTLWRDSFVGRGFPDGVCRAVARDAVRPAVRAADAYAALAHARTLAFVDGARVAVMGGSHGGSTTLATIVATDRNRLRGTPGFAAAIALYPGCGATYGDWKTARNGTTVTTSGVFKPLAPTLILSGALDDWTPAAHCQSLGEASHAAGLPMMIIVFPGAHHAFDSNAPVRFDETRVNANSPGGRGATTGGNPTAWHEARSAVRDFLAKHMPQPVPDAPPR